MERILDGLRVLEVSAFVAAPLGGATLAAMGAEVTRVDPLEGGVDLGRWPLHRGRSLYWQGLNRGKRSVTLDLRSARGRALVTRLAVEMGTVLTNLPPRDPLSYPRLRERRPDLIMVSIGGRADGRPAVDYTVNAGLGFPWITGPEGHDRPVNHVLPAWDVATGYLATAGLLAAERRRILTGRGGLVRLSLEEVALVVAGHLGLLDEARLIEEPRGRFGNHLYGTFGRDFRTGDGRYVIVLALTPRQWHSLAQATGLPFDHIRADLTDEGERWRHRHEICELLEPWIGGRTLAEVATAFEVHGVLWGPYRTFKEVVAEIDREPAVALDFGGERPPAEPGPRPGEHTEEVLRELGEDVEELRAAGVIA
ncbi:MAG TPA: CoA transferase [Candidatus Dormibacteraeota bacterium]|nr:CoA transferase [Candidatus Dormibacteraeota bacterium]